MGGCPKESKDIATWDRSCCSCACQIRLGWNLPYPGGGGEEEEDGDDATGVPSLEEGEGKAVRSGGGDRSAHPNWREANEKSQQTLPMLLQSADPKKRQAASLACD